MGHRKKLRILIGILKDMSSNIKATLSTSKRNAKVRLAVIRATAHTSSSSSHDADNRVAALLAAGNGSRLTACTCIEALMDRLHGTRSAHVALKCLFAIHNVITRGSFILKDQLSFYPSSGGRNFLNLSTFRDDSGTEEWRLSSYVRWYAAVLERNLMLSRFLGHFLSKNDQEEKVSGLLSNDIIKEVSLLVDFVEIICEAPDYLELQSLNLVYEVIRLVGEDYRSVQREVHIRVLELGDRMPSLSVTELAQFLGSLRRFVECKEKLRLLFVNKQRNDALWEVIAAMERKIVEVIREEGKVVKVKQIGWKEDSNELTRCRDRFTELGQVVRFNSGVGCLGLDRLTLTKATLGQAAE